MRYRRDAITSGRSDVLDLLRNGVVALTAPGVFTTPLAMVGGKQNTRSFRLITQLPLTEPALDFWCLRPPAGLRWFSGCLDQAFDRAETILATVLEKARFQLGQSVECSQDTALRDIDDLLARSILSKDGGRSTSYSLVLLPISLDAR